MVACFCFGWISPSLLVYSFLQLYCAHACWEDATRKAQNINNKTTDGVRSARTVVSSYNSSVKKKKKKKKKHSGVFILYHSSSITLCFPLLSTVSYIKYELDLGDHICASSIMHFSLWYCCMLVSNSLPRKKQVLFDCKGLTQKKMTFTAAVVGRRNMSFYKNQSQLHWRHNVTHSVSTPYPQGYKNTTNK